MYSPKLEGIWEKRRLRVRIKMENGGWGGFDKMRIIRGKRKGIKSKANVSKGEGKIAGYVRQKIKGVKRGGGGE